MSCGRIGRPQHYAIEGTNEEWGPWTFELSNDWTPDDELRLVEERLHEVTDGADYFDLLHHHADGRVSIW